MLVSQWLTAKSVGLLDRAYCNHQERESFLHVLQNSTASDIESSYDRDNYYHRLRWMNARNVKCSTFSFNSAREPPADKMELVTAYLIRNASYLRSVAVKSKKQEVIVWLLGLLVTHSCRLTVLSVKIGFPAGKQPHYYDSLKTLLLSSAAVLSNLCALCAMDWEFLTVEGACFPVLQRAELSVYGDADMHHICKASPHLKSIELIQTMCTSQGVAAIGQHCNELHTLNAGDSILQNDMDAGIVAVAEGCPQLKSLHLPNALVSDIGLVAVATHCTQLEELHLDNNDLITDATLTALASSACASTLRSLRLQGCTTITGTGILAVATHCTFLQALDVSYMHNITAAELVVIVPHLANIRWFSAPYTVDNNAVFCLIAEHMPLLEELILTTPFVDDDGGGSDGDGGGGYVRVSEVTELVRKCAKLRVLNLSEGLYNVTYKDVARWRKLCPELELVGCRYR